VESSEKGSMRYASTHRTRLHDPTALAKRKTLYPPSREAAPLGGRWSAPIIDVQHPHRVAALPRRRVAGGAELALPRWLREGEGGLGRGKAPFCSRSWSARTPTL